MIFYIDNQRTTFFEKKDILKKYLEQQNPTVTITSESLSEYFLLNGPWLLTISHYRHELINIEKTNN